MTRSLTASLAVAAAFVLAGCSTPSLNGVPESDRVDLDALEGVWVSEDTTVRIEAGDDKLYMGDTNGSRVRVQIAIADFDGRYVADATLDTDSAEHEDPILLSFVVPVHKFARIALEGDTLTYAELKDGWVTDHATGSLGGLTKVGDQHVLTGSEAQVHALLAKALDDEDAWEDSKTFTRLKKGED
ncbi:MAG: hypothetical protein R3B57_00855 [Phycisphaerales bacterium]